MSGRDSANQPPLNAGFTQGGDIIVRTVDGIDFSVHSAILSVASPVFFDMFALGTNDTKAPITVAETADMFALMLKFIYPLPNPPISKFEILNKALHVADKYQLKGMRSHLRERLTLASSPVSVLARPLDALGIASAHGFQGEAKIATIFASGRYNFCTPEGLLKLTTAVPSTIPWVQLIGIPAARLQILTDVLFSFHKEPMKLNQDFNFLCRSCQSTHLGVVRHSPPEWQARWAHWVFTEIQSRSADKWDEYFGVPFFYSTLYRGAEMPIRTPKGECTCMSNIYEDQSKFVEWTSTVRAHLKSRLSSLDPIEALRAP